MSDETAVVRSIGRYQVLNELGRGAMGVVYRGFDPVIRRTVALKTIAFVSEDAESTALRQRLYREATAAGTLTHPNIVTIYDIIEDGNTTAVAMEFVEGQTLSSLIGQGGALPFDHALRIFEQVCSALDYAGSKGIIHRDIKPANILLAPDGRPKILDFGIARISTSGLTQTGTIMGSPSYMSPEQVRGLPLDPRSDLFSAAVVLYEMLTGERPFGGDDVATTMYRIVNEPPRAMEHANPAISPTVASVLEWALSKNPGDRFQSGAELIGALRGAVDSGGAGEFVSAVPADAQVEMPAGKRSPILLYGLIGSGVLFVAVILLIVLGGGSVTQMGVSTQQPAGGAAMDAGAALVPVGPAENPVPAQPLSVEPSAGPPPASTPPSSGGMSSAPLPNQTAPASRTAAGTDAGATARPPASGGISPAGDRASTAPPAAPAGRQPPRSAADPVGAIVTQAAQGSPPGMKTPPQPAPTTAPRAPVAAVEAPATARPPGEPRTEAMPSRQPAPSPPSPATPGPGEAVLRVGFDGQPYPVTLFSGDTVLGRVDSADGSVTVEPGAARLRAVNEAMFLNADLGTISLRPGERRTVLLPGLASAVFGVKGEDYAGVRLLVDGRQVPGPYPAQIGRIAAGVHRVVYRWVAGAAAGREIADTITISAGGHFSVRAVLENEKIVVQQLR